MQRIRLEISYDGTAYNGWQKQPDGSAIQNHLEKALSRIFNQEINTIGSGRTDTGVHAFAQNAHFDCGDKLPTQDLTHSLNSMLPKDIVINRSWIAPNEFHALHSAEKKDYQYRVLNRPQACPFRRNFAWHVKRPLEIANLNRLSQVLCGEHDFQSFQTAGTPVPDTVRTIYGCDWQPHGEDELLLKITGNGFLKQMVRNLVGALVQLSQIEPDAAEANLREILAAKDRQAAPAPAPPQGLSLWRVYYPQDLLDQCREISRGQ